jgi:hypothetical protein
MTPFMHRSVFRFAAFLATCLLPIALSPDAHGDLVTLYSGAGRPSEQAWLVFAASPLGTTTETVLGSGVRLQTNGTAQAGYSNYIPALPPSTPALKNPAFPTLDRTKGFELAFSVAVESESHANNDRAGFSVILLGADARGIEVGFWTDRIWAQNDNPLFTQGEGVATDTTADRTYRLQIAGDNYKLLEGATEMLTGSVRNYATFGTPYNLSNYVFVGDNTTSAAASVRLGAMSLQSDLTSVPEPTSWLLAACASLGFGFGRLFFLRPT